MPIQQTKKQTDLEKRLGILRQQLYGKPAKETTSVHIEKKTTNQKNDTLIYRQTQSQNNSGTIRSDISYLYNDLIKIGIFATLTLGVQTVLFFLIKNHIVNLNFF